MIARTMPARMSFNYKVENDNYIHDIILCSAL